MTEDTKKALWREIDKTRTGMLQAGAHGQAQPMTAFTEPERGRLWFFTRRGSDLARAVGEGAEAQFIFVSKDQEIHASLRGAIVETLDPAAIEEFWSPMVAAWYPGGKTDPELTLLRLDLQDGDVWVSTQNAVKLAWEVAKANVTGQEPDIGRHDQLKLH